MPPLPPSSCLSGVLSSPETIAYINCMSQPVKQQWYWLETHISLLLLVCCNLCRPAVSAHEVGEGPAAHVHHLGMPIRAALTSLTTVYPYHSVQSEHVWEWGGAGGGGRGGGGLQSYMCPTVGYLFK